MKLSKNEWELSISSYARLLISKMLPSLDRALYIDCDTITLNQKAIDLNISLQKEIINKFDSIIINGIKFNKE